MPKGLHHNPGHVECDDSSDGNIVLKRLFYLVTPFEKTFLILCQGETFPITALYLLPTAYGSAIQNVVSLLGSTTALV